MCVLWAITLGQTMWITRTGEKKQIQCFVIRGAPIARMNPFRMFRDFSGIAKMPKPIRCYDYVNRPYAEVCDALRCKSNAVFHDATLKAESRGGDVAAGLHVTVAGFEVTKNVEIQVKSYTEVESRFGKKMTVQFEWKAADSPGFFPSMNAQLDIYPITNTETQLDFHGQYDPPLGMMGKAIDAVLGRRIAEASVHQFLAEVATHLRTQAVAPVGDPAPPNH